MRLPTPPVIGLAVFTFAYWSCSAGRVGLRQSAAAEARDVADGRPIARSLPAAPPRTLTSRAGPLEPLRNTLNKEQLAPRDVVTGIDDVAEAGTRLSDVAEDVTRFDDVTEGSALLNGVAKDVTRFDDVTEGSTLLGDVADVPRFDDVMEGSTLLDDVTEGDTQFVDATEDVTRFHDVTEDVTRFHDVTEGSTLLNDVAEDDAWYDDFTEGSTLLNDITEGDKRFDGVTEGSTLPYNVTEGSTLLYDVTEGSTLLYDVAEDDAWYDDFTEGSTLRNDVTEGDTRFDGVTEGSILHYDVTEGSTLLNDVAEDDAWYDDFMGGITLLNDATEGDTRFDGVTEGSILPYNVTEGSPLPFDVTEGSTLLYDVAEDDAWYDDFTEGSTLPNDATEGDTRFDGVTGGSALPYDVTEGITSLYDATGAGGTAGGDVRVGRANGAAILDEKGFVVPRPEEERRDEAGDWRIYEAVVTSVAQWELAKLRSAGKRRVRRDEEVVCYVDLGCFRDEGPFDYLDMLPSPPEQINTKFLLYTREDADEGGAAIRAENASSIGSSSFRASRPTKLLIHGFGSSCSSVWIREMRVALLTMMDVNVVCVDWAKGAEVPNYVRAASNTRLVGRQVALLVEALASVANASLDDFHLIGFSLGAHVSGHAGARLQNLSRISGLDPAGPLFESYAPSVRLDRSDALFVDVIHTNADSLLMGGLGAFEAMGHVDFYPNGGRMQKGCANLFVGGVSDILWPTEGDGRYLCNHRRGYKYYLDSLAPVCAFPSFACRDYETFLTGDCFPCSACGSMGYFADRAGGRGPLYLVTRDTEPFCANQYKVTVHHSGGAPSGALTTYGRLDATFVASGGVNETLRLTRSDDEALEAGKATVRIVVPHPALEEVVALQLRYTSYKGWIYSGFALWAIDKVSLMDSFGATLSFCRRGTTLVSGKTLHLALLKGDCTAREEEEQPPPAAGPNPQRFGEESDNEVRRKPPLRLAVGPRRRLPPEGGDDDDEEAPPPHDVALLPKALASNSLLEEAAPWKERARALPLGPPEGGADDASYSSGTPLRHRPPPPTETIVGRGRAPQPRLLLQQEENSRRTQQEKNSRRTQQEKNSRTAQNATRGPPPPPYYVQVLPASFGLLPRQEAPPSSSGRVLLLGRAGRGRSLRAPPPPSGGRAAVLAPLVVLQLLQEEQEEEGRRRPSRYIPLRRDALRQDIRHETLRQEALRQEAIRQETLRQEALRQEAIRQETLRQEALRQETLRQETLRQETLRQEVPPPPPPT